MSERVEMLAIAAVNALRRLAWFQQKKELPHRHESLSIEAKRHLEHELWRQEVDRIMLDMAVRNLARRGLLDEENWGPNVIPLIVREYNDLWDNVPD